MPPIRPTGNRVDAQHPDAPDLAGFGPHPVGVCTIERINPAQTDLPGPDKTGTRDRPLTIEFWYPAREGSPQGGEYSTLLRDGKTPVTLHGRAWRNAKGAAGDFPLVLISHGYPGNRFLMAHLGETLASRGFAVAAADHPGSTYADKGLFASTLLHRPLDQRFAIDSLATARDLPVSLDCDNVAVIGYSMGAYGALVFAGAGLSAAGTGYSPDHADALSRHAEGSAALASLVDPRVKAVVPIGLWGGQHGFWTKGALASIQKPVLLIGGSDDAISGYETGILPVFHGLTGATRHLLTFAGAGHNAAAPIPAPEESWAAVPDLDFLPAEHYADAVWDSLWMNAVAQHVIAGFLAHHLQGRAEGPTLGLTGQRAQGITLQTLQGRA